MNSCLMGMEALCRMPRRWIIRDVVALVVDLSGPDTTHLSIAHRYTANICIFVIDRKHNDKRT